jgi:hypothetical protein
MSKTLIKEILLKGDIQEVRALFQFSSKDSDERVLFKYKLWANYFFPKFFKSEDAPFHNEMNLDNLKVYRGVARSFTNCGFRGCSKTTNTKLFIAYCIANDADHSRRYIKVLSEDNGNAKQVVTDVYNMLIDVRVRMFYQEIFAKTTQKREETMSSFTTSTGVKVLADTVGSDQRGQIQEDARPDVIWFDDFETRNTLRSAVKTKSIWDNMQEAIEGLAKGGGFVATCNYLSERGNVHKLVERASDANIVLITPLVDKAGNPMWASRYSKQDCETILASADDAEGEYLQNPALSKDTYFDRESIDKMEKLTPLKTIAGFKMFKDYKADHAYAMGADVAGGVGLDSSTSVLIDFSTVPAQVVATYHNNEIAPDTFGDELARQGERFGECYIAPEKNNHGHATLGRLKQIYPTHKIHRTQRDDTKIGIDRPVEYGWETNALTKPRMLSDLSKAIETGLIALNDPDLIKEARAYTRNDMMDKEIDPRLATKHYDLLTACAIGWQMRGFATKAEEKDNNDEEYVPEKPIYSSIGM